jgi:hypothetical protein
MSKWQVSFGHPNNDEPNPSNWYVYRVDRDQSDGYDVFRFYPTEKGALEAAATLNAAVKETEATIARISGK